MSSTILFCIFQSSQSGLVATFWKIEMLLGTFTAFIYRPSDVTLLLYS